VAAVVVYGAIVCSLIGAILGLSYFLGGRHNERATNEPYEGGIVSQGPLAFASLPSLYDRYALRHC